MNILWRNISLPAFLTNLPKDVDAYPGLGPGQMFVHTQATHTHLNLSLQMCYPSNRDLVFRTLSVCLFPFNVTSLCRLLPALTCFLRSVLRSSAFLRLTASWLISKWHLNTVFKKKMFVNHVTSFSQPDMECLLYYSVFNKKKKWRLTINNALHGRLHVAMVYFLKMNRASTEHSTAALNAGIFRDATEFTAWRQWEQVVSDLTTELLSHTVTPRMQLPVPSHPDITCPPTSVVSWRHLWLAGLWLSNRVWNCV